MEFQKTVLAHLQTQTADVQSREETVETAVPDSLPEIGRIVGTWGIPLVRSKEWQEDGVHVSGGMTAWVLYVPEDGTEPRQISAYLPMHFHFALPQTDPKGQVLCRCFLKTVEARMLGARKLLIRAGITCTVQGYTPTETEIFTLENPPEDLEVLRKRLPLTVPTELSEKNFLLDEETELPGAAPEISKLIAYRVEPVIRDSKVLGEKALFKGSCNLHLLYETPEKQLAVWDFDIPFSQYAELSQSYDREEGLQVELLLGEAEVSVEPEGRRVQLRCRMTAQCLVETRKVLDLVTDLYSLHRTVTPQVRTIPMQSRLDRQKLRIPVQEDFSISGGSLVDCQVLTDAPKTRGEGDRTRLEIPLWCSILYYDREGKLQGRANHGTASTEIKLAQGCPCHATAEEFGPVQWSLGGGTASVRGNLEVTVESNSKEEPQCIWEAQLGDPIKPDPNRPSLILRKPAPEENLWSIAKTSGSTVSAIQSANHLDQEPLNPEKLLLIPVL